MSLVAYKNDTKLKDNFVAEIEKHQEADQILQGTYGEGSGKSWRGCAVGCSVHSLNRIKKKRYSTDNHKVYETELGVPKELAHLEDGLFESLDVETAKKWPLRFAQAIPVGADLSLITAQFVIWQFEDKKYGLKYNKEVKADKEVFGFCKEVVALYKRKLVGDTPSEKEFYKLYLRIDRAGAWAGAGAGAGAWAWAGAGARAGAWAWAGAGAWAWAWAWAWAGAWAGDKYDTAYAEYIKAAADKLIELLEKAPR